MTRTFPILATLALGLTAAGAAAQEPVMPDTIRYALGWDNPASQLYTVRVTARAAGEPVVFSLPAWRPGRYILQNYAANVQAVRAEDEAGRSLTVEWLDLDSWRVEPAAAKTVTLAYEFHAAVFDAGSSTLRPDLAYFNPVNLLPWVEGRMDHPVTLRLGAPEDWDVATQLDRLRGRHLFSAPDYHALADAPTIAAPKLTEWEFTLDDVPYHVVFRGTLDLGEHERGEILADLEAIAREQTALFGGAPFDAYWFLYQLVPYPFGHAVEHAASASFVLQDNLFQGERDAYLGFLGVTAHELFHAWNVKRIRPAALWPYDYRAPQLTRLHWVTEGVTSYYEEMTMARAGLVTPNELHATLGRNIQSLESTPGRRVTSPSLSSLTAWHSGYGGGNPTAAISFYTQGAVLGLLLDLTIRDASDGAQGLDDVMRALYRDFYLQDRGVPEDGVQRAAEAAAGRPLDRFFADYVHGTAVPPYDEILSVVGLTARQVADTTRPAATLGLAARPGDGGTVTIAAVLPGGPALEAGLMQGDVLVSIGDQPVVTPDLRPILSGLDPGAEVAVTVRRGGGEPFEREVMVGGGGNLRWVVEPVAAPTERQARLRAGWLASATTRQ